MLKLKLSTSCLACMLLTLLSACSDMYMLEFAH